MSAKITLEEWNRRVQEMNPSARIVNSCTINGEDVYIIHCNDCGATYDVRSRLLKTAYSHRQKNTNKTQQKYCPICTRHRCYRGINDVATVRKDLLPYFVNIEDAKNYTPGSSHVALLRCPYCNKTRKMSLNQLSFQGFICKYCADSISIPNKMLRGVMLQLPVEDLKFEFSSGWSCKKKYDCYFIYNSKKYLVEIDGEQHIRNTEWSTQQVQQENDKLKSKLAKENNYNLIRIPAYDSDLNSIKGNILKSELATIFDLTHLKWDEIYKGTASNVNIEICNYYNEHKKEIMMKDMAKHFHICTRTLTLILQRMTKLGLCQYSQEESFINRGKHISRSKRKGE